MDLQDFLTAVPAAEGLCPGQRVNLHHNLLLLAVAEECVFHVINLEAKVTQGSAQHPSGFTPCPMGGQAGAGCVTITAGDPAVGLAASSQPSSEPEQSPG